MSDPNSLPVNPLDPDIYDWCSEQSRSERIIQELKSSIRILLWHGNLPEIVKSWAKRELIQSALDSKLLWTSDIQEIQYKEAIERLNASQASIDNSLPCSPIDSEAWCLGDAVLKAWSEKQWGHKLETLYLSKKNELDIVTASLIRMKSQFLSFEVYQRLKSKEASFEELSWTFGEGAEKNQGGRFYKQRIYSIPSGLRSMIRKIKPGEVLKPHKLGDWYAILTLDEFEPAQFDEATKDLLLSFELENWLHQVSLLLVDQLKLEC